VLDRGPGNTPPVPGRCLEVRHVNVLILANDVAGRLAGGTVGQLQKKLAQSYYLGTYFRIYCSLCLSFFLNKIFHRFLAGQTKKGDKIKRCSVSVELSVRVLWRMYPSLRVPTRRHDTTKTLWRRQSLDDDGKQEARERCATHPRQQSTHADSWEGRRQERGTIVGDRMTEKDRGGDDLVETFELREITSLPYFRAPRSSERTGTYSACVLPHNMPK
jgi:hypothetical protein